MIKPDQAQLILETVAKVLAGAVSCGQVHTDGEMKKIAHSVTDALLAACEKVNRANHD